jgi:hypothetical protein
LIYLTKTIELEGSFTTTTHRCFVRRRILLLLGTLWNRDQHNILAVKLSVTNEVALALDLNNVRLLQVLENRLAQEGLNFLRMA